MNKLTIFTLCWAFAGSIAIAQDESTDTQTTASIPEPCAKLQASTVFVADKTGARHKGSAKKISAAHEKAEAEGWSFDELAVYTENGDLQGFFITYTRTHPCNFE